MSMTASDDDLLFDDDDATSEPATNEGQAWKLLIVDDDQEVHTVTRLVLDGFTFADRNLECLSAHSGAEAKKIMAEQPDIAVMLLDVVMENDHAGLEVARHVREDLGNHSVRIVLRTGQPGQAPERTVIRDYDINDYKEKTELTAQKLYTLMHACLRSYRDIRAIEANKLGLEKVLVASASIFQLKSMENFTHGVMEQMISLLHADYAAIFCQASGLAAACEEEKLNVIVATGEYEEAVGKDAREFVDPLSLRDLQIALSSERNVYSDGRFTGYFAGRENAQNLVHLSGLRELTDIDRNLIEIFSRNVGVAFENMHLKQEIEDTQKEVVYRLGEAVETRSRETGNHVKRVAEYSKLLALGYGLSEEEAEILKLASPLHDVGKVGIPDAILNKPGKLTAEEWAIMQTHAELGYEMLRKSKRPILQAGATIAMEHHEKWDGSGYPNAKAGEDIHIYGRITALADVFDALGSERCYKKAWPLEDVFALLRDQSGSHFDPNLVELFFSEQEKFIAIRDAFPDVTDPA